MRGRCRAGDAGQTMVRGKLTSLGDVIRCDMALGRRDSVKRLTDFSFAVEG